MTITPLKQKKNNMFWTNFKLCLKQNKKILIVISILQLLGLPMLAVILNTIISDNGDRNELSLVFFTLISFFCLGVSVICGIIIAVNNFSYLHKKSQVDMIYSLPIKRKYKFLSDFFSGLAVYAIPYIAACILSNLILLAGAFCIDDMHELLTDGSFFALDIQCEFAGLLMMTLLYTLTVLVLNCCGTLFESIMNILILNALIPGAIAVIAAMFFANLYGVSIFDTVLPILGYTSPIGGIIYLFCMFATSINYTYDTNYDIFGCIDAGVFGKWAVFFLLFTTLVFFLSMFLYKKRKAEDVSKPYVYKLLYYMVITTIVMAISLIARYNMTAIVPVIVFSLIVYLIFEVITNRGFKKIYKSFIRYAITMVSILILGIIASATNGFGTESRVPSVSSVRNVKVSYQGFDRSIVNEERNDLDEDRRNILVYDQKEIIEKVIEVHKDALDTYQSGEFKDSAYSDDYYNYYEYGSDTYYDGSSKSDYPYYKIQFCYTLNTGSKLTRTYILTYEQAQKLFVLDSTPQMSEYLEKKLMNVLYYSNYYNGARKDTYSIYISNIINWDAKDNYISKEHAREISKAYAEDYKNMTEEQMLTDSVYCYINNSFVVRESFKNTIACMEKYNLTVPEITADDLENRSILLFSNQNVKCWGDDNITASFGSYYNDYEIYENVTNEIMVKELDCNTAAELFKKGMAKAPYYEDANCYVIMLDNQRFVIPSEYSKEAHDILFNRQTT
jgi:hypothetical protein